MHGTGHIFALLLSLCVSSCASLDLMSTPPTPQVPLDGIDAITSSTFLYRGVSPEAEGVMSALGFQAPLRMIQEGFERPSARATAV